jgi:hypothetical protein
MSFQHSSLPRAPVSVVHLVSLSLPLGRTWATACALTMASRVAVLSLLAVGLPSYGAASGTVQVGLQAVVLNVFDPAGYVPDYIAPGDTLVGQYTYELDAVDVSPDPRIGGYQYAGAPNSLVVYADSGWVFQTDETSVLIYFSIADSFVSHGVPYDGYLFRSQNNTGESRLNGRWLPMGLMQIELIDYTLQAMTSDSLPTAPPDLSAWPDERKLLITGDDFAWDISAEIISFTSLPPTAVVNRPRSNAWLGNARPNPFNPNTTLPLLLDSAGHAVMTIYDIRGRPVRTLLDERLDAGTYKIQWDGRDRMGNRAASGVYFCRLGFQGQAVVRKITLLK